MGRVVEITRSNPDAGTPEERLICDCGHKFTRARLDIMYTVYIDETYSETELRILIDDRLSDHVTQRAECPECSCCHEEDDEICRDDTEDWMCCVCGSTGFESESDALDCCA